jgi:hypothetical protein
LFREHLLVSLAPRAVAWVRLAGAWQRRVAARAALETDPGYGAEPWQGALEALRTEAQAWRSTRLEVRVVLSNHFARYAIVPAPEHAAGEDEARALARFHFAKIHGERARSWDIRLAPERAGAPRLACAIDAGLLEGLRGCFPAGGRARLASVQPYLMSAFNRSRRALPRAGAWFVLLEPGRACLGLIAGGAWRAIRSVRGEFWAAQECKALLDRERCRVGLEAQPEAVLHSGADDAYALALSVR